MSKRIWPVLFAVIVTISVFLFFKIFSGQKLPDFAKEILAAVFGSVITVAITMILLLFQSASEVSRDKSIAVFQEKLRVYEGFCEFLSDIAADELLSVQEEKSLRHWAMRVSLVCGEEVSTAIDMFFRQTHRYGTLFFDALSEEQRADLVELHRTLTGNRRGPRKPEDCFISVGALVAHLKHDLGEAEISKLKDITSAQHAVDDVLRPRL